MPEIPKAEYNELLLRAIIFQFGTPANPSGTIRELRVKETAMIAAQDRLLPGYTWAPDGTKEITLGVIVTDENGAPVLKKPREAAEGDEA